MSRPSPTALITGASSGIGRDLAREIAGRGYGLVLVARDPARLESIAAEIRERNGVPVRIEACDLGDARAREALVARLAAEPIDFLVNNAGVGVEGPFVETDWARESAMIDLNVDALVHLTKAFLPGMVERRSGRVLQIASTAAFQPGPYLALYFATKAFVFSFSQALAHEVRGTGVTVTTVCPGPTHTEFERRLDVGSSGLFGSGIPVARSSAVARYAVASAMRGKRLAVHGWVNRFMIFVDWISPRAISTPFVAWLVGRNHRPAQGRR